MADKEIVAEIKRRREAWPAAFASGITGRMGIERAQVETEAIVGALGELVAELRAVAELYGRAKMRGAKGETDELNAAARVLDAIGAKLRSMPAAPGRGGPSVPAEWCGDTADHPPHTWRITGDDGEGGVTPGPMRECLGRQARDTTGLQALVDERALRDRMVINPAVGPDFTGGAFTEAYLTGALGDIPGSPPLGPGSVTSAPELDNPFASDEGAGTVTGPAMSREPQSAADLFDDPAPVGWSNATTSADGYRLPGNVPPTFDDPAPRAGSIGARVSWGDLRDLLGKDRRGAGLPVHLSHSQCGTIEECGLKYLMQRDEQLGVVEIPQWALIGGNAFHLAVEWFERVAAEVRTEQHVRDRLQVFRDEHGGREVSVGEALWSWAFGQQITETALKSPVPQDQWRASKQGLEGYTFWLINGGDYVQRYLDARLIEIGGQGWRSIRRVPNDERTQLTPMIEWEYLTEVEGVPFKGVIDQVWTVTQQHGPMAPGDLLIDDCKSGAKVGPDTRQLGEYALWLLQHEQSIASPLALSLTTGRVRIWGRFYDARRGTWTEPIDLLATHSMIEMETRVAGADLKKQHGMFTPNRTNFCGGCSVKHACPIFATAGT